MTEPAPDLTPAEALLLMDPHGASGTRLLKITLVALLLQRVLRIEARDVRGRFSTSTAMHLWIKEAPGALPPHAASVAEVVASAKGGTMEQAAAEATAIYGPGLDRLKQHLVHPALVRRGYLGAMPKRFLFFRWTTTAMTPAGQVALAELRARLDQARNIPHDLENNPRRAAMTAVALGPLILLVDELRPHLKQLARVLRPPGDGEDAPVDTSLESASPQESASPHQSCHDAIDLDGLDAGSILLLGGSMPAFDAGFDAGFSDDAGGAGDEGGHSGSDGGGH